MAQIRQVVSETLQATIRRLLPSQQGFTEDLMATNVITPVIDLTPSAEGSNVPEYQAQALAFGSQTGYNVSVTTSDVITTTGFYRVVGTWAIYSANTGAQGVRWFLNDGSATEKNLFRWNKGTTASVSEWLSSDFDFIVFINSGEKLRCESQTGTSCIGSYRQLADINGNIVNPSGFTPS